MEIAQIYLGNLAEDRHLAAKVRSSSQSLPVRSSSQSLLEVYLSQDDRAKGRIQAQSTSGIAVGIIKGRDWSLRSQDVFMTETENLLLIHFQEQKLMVLSFEESLETNPVELVHLGHVLGNNHYPIAIADHKIYLQLPEDPRVIEQAIEALQIKSLVINYESRSPEQSLNFAHHHH